MDKKEYNDLLLKLYSENNAFIEKAVFTVSVGAIMFLLGYIDKISESMMLAYAVGIFLFLVTLIIQLITAYISREACDGALGGNEDANMSFDKSRRLSNGFSLLFCIAIIYISSIIAINANNLVKENNSKYSFEQKITTNEYEYIESRVFVDKRKTVNNGSNPPMTIKQIGQDGANPPKTMQPKPVPNPDVKK